MAIRMGILAVVLALGLSACSDDESGSDSGDTPSDPLTEITIDCDQFEDAAQRITEAQAELYADSGSQEAIDTLLEELEALEADAPPGIQAALDDMSEGFQDAAELLEDPTRKSKERLADLAPELAEDGQEITDYITSQCE